MITANRYHDISCGHRVYGHESKCAHLHGHNYRFHFFVAPNTGLDKVGRVMDFSVIKNYLCDWLEKNWDHKFLLWREDPKLNWLRAADVDGVVSVPFNPTAENIAEYFVEQIAPSLLAGTGCTLVKLTIEETRKCSVTYEKEKAVKSNLDVRYSAEIGDFRGEISFGRQVRPTATEGSAGSSGGAVTGSYEERRGSYPGDAENKYGGFGTED